MALRLAPDPPVRDTTLARQCCGCIDEPFFGGRAVDASTQMRLRREQAEQYDCRDEQGGHRFVTQAMQGK